jgi:hypothetical protein
MDILPDEIILEIIEFLHFRYIIRLMLSTRKVYEISNNKNNLLDFFFKEKMITKEEFDSKNLFIKPTSSKSLLSNIFDNIKYFLGF